MTSAATDRPRWAVAGLGNPGARYAGTRHNVGFDVLSRLACRWRAELTPAEVLGLGCESATIRFERTDVFLVRPLTYMNRSGLVVAPFAAAHRIAPDRTLVMVDDMALPVGTIRFRQRGSSGGHNGLASIEAALDTDAYPRLRIGVGPAPDSTEWTDYVLTRFESDERERVDEALERATEGVETMITLGIERTMSLYNG